MILHELIKLVKGKPTQLKIITYYNIINFVVTLVISIFLIGALLFAIMSNEKFDPLLLLTFLMPLIAILYNYIALVLNKKLFLGSKRAFWIMFFLYLIECLKISLGQYSFELNFSPIPLLVTIDLENNNLISFNIVPIFATIYLFTIRNKYKDILIQFEKVKKIKDTKVKKIKTRTK